LLSLQIEETRYQYDRKGNQSRRQYIDARRTQGVSGKYKWQAKLNERLKYISLTMSINKGKQLNQYFMLQIPLKNDRNGPDT
jgi:hypothetical protein